MAKKPKNKKAPAKKKKSAAKPASSSKKKNAGKKKKSVKKVKSKHIVKKTAGPQKKNIKKLTEKAGKKALKQKAASKSDKKEKKAGVVIVAVKEKKPKKTIKQEIEINNNKKEPRQKIRESKPPKEKVKKIIKAPLIIPNQRIAEKEIAPVVKKAEPKGKYELEFVVRSSPAVLFELLSTPSGLSEWFADDVNIRDDIFTFFWDGSAQSARVTGLRDNEYIRFQWIEKKDGSYFEFRLQIDELTSDVSLIITDFAENESEKASSSLLWESQVNKLLHVIGSYF